MVLASPALIPVEAVELEPVVLVEIPELDVVVPELPELGPVDPVALVLLSDPVFVLVFDPVLALVFDPVLVLAPVPVALLVPSNPVVPDVPVALEVDEPFVDVTDDADDPDPPVDADSDPVLPVEVVDPVLPASALSDLPHAAAATTAAVHQTKANKGVFLRIMA